MVIVIFFCYSAEADFNNTVLTVSFPSDELSPLAAVSVPIGIVDDDIINEAYEKLFIVHLEVLEAVSIAKVVSTEKNTSICRIVDNDRKPNFARVLLFCYANQALANVYP